MKELYAVRIIFENGTEITFDSDRPLELEEGLNRICTLSKNELIINSRYVVCVGQQHLTLTEEGYKNRCKL